MTAKNTGGMRGHKALRLALLNPNTNAATTAMMVDIARASLPPGVAVEGHTMALGPTVITDEASLSAAARQVVTVGASLARDGVDAILISGFGDPGLYELRDRLGIPVAGIAEAGMAEAARHGRFSIITTTPDLRASILRQVHSYGHDDRLASLLISAGGVGKDMATPANMIRALSGLTRNCVEDGAGAILIGGGPLARAVGALAASCPLPVIDPVAAGVRSAAAAAGH